MAPIAIFTNIILMVVLGEYSPKTPPITNSDMGLRVVKVKKLKNGAVN